MPRGRLHVLFALLLAAGGGGPLVAQRQVADSVAGGGHVVYLGSPEEERLRLGELLGARSAIDPLFRSAGMSLGQPVSGHSRPRWGWIAPTVVTVWNSEIPSSSNDRALWAGRGANVDVVAGVHARLGRFSLVLAPELVYSENGSFGRPLTRVPGRSSFAAPWYSGDWSADLPVRFGDRPLLALYPGQSSLAASLGPASVGVATENQWWGPGIRNAIVLSDNAPGFPHAFVRTARPLRTRFGSFSAQWIGGALTESFHFDTTSANDQRTISGAIATFRPSGEPDLALGLARMVVSGATGRNRSPMDLLGAFSHWGSGGAASADSTFQLLSAFARWVFPADGFELYSEWARVALPSSLVDLLVAPQYTHGYTLGLQWARPIGRPGTLRLHSEVTYLEESSTWNRRPTRGFYVSPTVVQGYTERGQSLGAAIGPGGSSQWVAADLFGARSRIGLFAGRTRSGNDVYYTLPVGESYLSHDVAIYGGARAGFRAFGVEADGSATVTRRYNFLFQNPAIGIEGEKAVDLRNVTFQLSLHPTLRAPR